MRLAATALAAVAMALTAGGPGAAAAPAAPDRAGASTFFQSPSGNIGCVIDRQSGVRCDIRNRVWRPPPKPEWCPDIAEWGNGMAVDRRGRGNFTCANDSVFGGGRELGYGDSIRRGRFRCVSRRSGMRCVNRRNGHGFVLSREQARRF